MSVYNTFFILFFIITLCPSKLGNAVAAYSKNRFNKSFVTVAFDLEGTLTQVMLHYWPFKQFV